MHPYEMLQTLRDRHDDVTVPVSIGSLYHSVSRLCERGYVRPLKAEHVGNRPERTTYEILDRGLSAMRERIAALLATPTALSAADHAGLGELHNLWSRTCCGPSTPVSLTSTTSSTATALCSTSPPGNMSLRSTCCTGRTTGRSQGHVP